MPKLPVMAIVLSAFSFFGEHLGKLIHWQLPPLGVNLLAGGAGFLAYKLTGHWLPVLPCLLLAIMAWVPFLIQVNQLVVSGQAQTGHYLARIFEAQSLRFLGYAVLVQVIITLGLFIACIPVGLAGLSSGFTEITPRLILGFLVSTVLGMVFMVLVSPLKLIYPSVAVEEQPSLGTAYNLGADNKLRLFLVWLLPGLFFSLVNLVVDGLANLVGGSDTVRLIIVMPLEMALLAVNIMINITIPALAYRFLTGTRVKASPGQDATLSS